MKDMTAVEEWEIYQKLDKEFRLDDLYSVGKEEFDRTLNKQELDKAYNIFEDIYDSDKTVNDCLSYAVSKVIKERKQ